MLEDGFLVDGYSFSAMRADWGRAITSAGRWDSLEAAAQAAALFLMDRAALGEQFTITVHQTQEINLREEMKGH